MKSTKTTPNVSTSELNNQIVSPPSNDQLIRPSSLFKQSQSQQRQPEYVNEPEFLNENRLSIPRPNLTSSNINIRVPSASSNINNNVNSRFDNYIY